MDVSRSDRFDRGCWFKALKYLTATETLKNVPRWRRLNDKAPVAPAPILRVKAHSSIPIDPLNTRLIESSLYQRPGSDLHCYGRYFNRREETRFKTYDSRDGYCEK